MPTFPTYPGKLPKCLNPFNWRHYFLVLYWIFFRPTALKCYLYQADPELYRGGSGKGIGTALALPAYRNLILVSSWAACLIWDMHRMLRLLLDRQPILNSVYWDVSPMRVAFMLAIGLAFSVLLSVLLSVVFSVVLRTGVPSVVGMSLCFILALPVVFMVSVRVGEAMAFVKSGVLGILALGLAFSVSFSMYSGVEGGAGLHVLQFAAISLFGLIWVWLYPGSATGAITNLAQKLWFELFFSMYLSFSLRLPFYIIQGGGLLRAPWRGLHPIWWDELAVLPFLQSEVAIAQAWRSGDERGLRRLAQLTANPFQHWVVQRALMRRLLDGASPIHFLYSLFQIQQLGAYAIAPMAKSDWLIIPSVLQIYLNELAGVGGGLAGIGDKWVCSITQPLRIKVVSPLVDLARLLHHLAQGIVSRDGAPVGHLPEDTLPAGVLLKGVDAGEFHTLTQSLLVYPGGEELQRSFSCMASCLRATSLAELANGEAWFKGMPAAEAAIRPPVIEALGRFAGIRQDIAVSEVASSRVNQLAALGRATEGLEELRVFITREVWSPEQVLLQTILQRWRSLVSGASGRLGQLVVSQPVANPYVAGNPVTGQLFVGRDDILQELEELWLSQGQVDSVVLFGHRRMGKSSILKNLPARLDPTYNRVVHFNLQQIGRVRHTGELLHALALEMRDQLPASGPLSPAVPDQETFEANPNRAFSGWLKDIAPLMAQQRFIVAIDEYELLEAAMAEGRIEASLTTYLRSVIQFTDWFVLVLAGLYTLEEKCHDYWNPLFASIKPRKVSFLSPAATRLLLCQPSEDFPLNYTADTVEEVVRLSNGQPYLVQLIGQNLVTRFNRQVFELGQTPERPISLDDLLAVIDSSDFFQDGSPYFKGIWMQAADAPFGQQAILKALAQECKDLQQLAAETGLSEDMVKGALSTLCAHDVVVMRRPDDQCYEFTVELMRRWVLHTSAQLH